MARVVPVLCGPTAAGKTAVATALAALAPIEIVSADSRQIYRGLEIGTAKPAPDDRAAAPYHGLDLVHPNERYSAGRFAREAAGWLAGIEARGRIPIVVGGTGFYLHALFEGLFAEPPLDPAGREALRAALAPLGSDVLARWARRLDPAFRGGGRQRATRVIEVAFLAGRRLGDLQRKRENRADVARPLYFRLVVPRAELVERIASRAADMLARGFVDEVRAVLSAGVTPDAPGLSAVGYREVVAHVEGRLTAAELPGAIAAATRRYAKRQATWFRHQLRPPLQDLDGLLPPDALARTVLGGYRAACA